MQIKIKIIEDKCDGCSACVDSCPTDAITINKIAIIDEDNCIKCESCVQECPNKAIEIEKNSK